MENTQLMKANFAQIASFVAEQPEENHTLEFKRKTVSDALELHKDDRRNLGAAVSGFANATGGVLVLGVSTEKHQGLDRAKELAPIANASSVAARARSYLNECVAPVVEGIKVRAAADDNGSGLILVGVPRGQARPHMSTAPDHHTYYRRVIDSFVPMEAYEVEEMMRLKTEPQLRFIYEVRPAGSIGANRNFILLFGLENFSSVTAKFPYISFSRHPNGPTVDEYGSTMDLWPRVSDVASNAILFAAGADQVLHPGQRLFVSRLAYNEEFGPMLRNWGVSRLPANETLELTFQFGSEDAPMETAKIVLTREELLAG
jgi:hypothetical protein